MSNTYNYTVTLTEAENSALSYVALDQQKWIDDATHHRCHIAIEEIVQIAVQQCLSNNIQIPGTKDDIVFLAFQQGWVKTGVQRNADSSNNSII